MCSEWKLQFENSGRQLEPADIWIKKRIHSVNLDMSDPNEADTVLLSNPPTLSCKRYAKMSAYGNHWRVDDDINRSWNTFDSGVACFEANEQSAGTGKDYVGILQDILVPNYGDLRTPIIIFVCTWKKRVDNHNNNTYVRDSDGFLVVNFKHNLSRAVDPYIFPSQCAQVFFATDDLHPKGSQWMVILRKEARGRRKMEEDDDIFITTNDAAVSSSSGTSFLNEPMEPNLVGAIVLNDVENALALQSLDRPTGRKQVAKRQRR